jgi:hypothetical protein
LKEIWCSEGRSWIVSDITGKVYLSGRRNLASVVFRRLAFGPFDERRKQIKWHKQNGRGVMLARNFLHRLQEAQLQGDRLRGNNRCRLHEFFRGLKLGFGVHDFRAPFPLRLGLAGHRALHAVGQNNVFDLYGSEFDSRRIGLPIDDFLHASDQIYLVALREQFIEFRLSEHAALQTRNILIFRKRSHNSFR